MAKRTIKVFIGAVREDEKYVRELDKHLVLLERRGLIQSLYVGKGVMGGIGFNERKEVLKQVEIVVLFVSIDAVRSEVFKHEIDWVLERERLGKVRIVPVLLRSCEWEGLGLEKSRMFPRDGNTVLNRRDSDEAWVEIVGVVKGLAETLQDAVVYADEPKKEEDVKRWWPWAVGALVLVVGLALGGKGWGWFETEGGVQADSLALTDDSMGSISEATVTEKEERNPIEEPQIPSIEEDSMGETKKELEEARVKRTIEGMVQFEGGNFTMGCVEGDSFCQDDEKTRIVKIGSFYMGKYEVTLDEYAAYCKDKKPSKDCRKGKRPVNYVSFYDAIAYCNWLSQKQGLEACYTIKGKTVSCDLEANGYRLPTEAEWEFAARGGNTGHVYAGTSDKNIVYKYGNFCDSLCTHPMKERGYKDGFAKAAPVGSYLGNRKGLFDMSGNVAEWCWDEKGEKRAIRGGHWNGSISSLRISNRQYLPAGEGYIYVGFRFIQKGGEL